MHKKGCTSLICVCSRLSAFVRVCCGSLAESLKSAFVCVCARLVAFVCVCKHPVLLHPLLRHPDRLFFDCARKFPKSLAFWTFALGVSILNVIGSLLVSEPRIGTNVLGTNYHYPGPPRILRNFWLFSVQYMGHWPQQGPGYSTDI